VTSSPVRPRRLEWIGSAVVLAIATWYWLRYFNRNTNLLDEGSTVAQAMRVLRGELIYRDFFTVVTPFSYYTVAALFRMFGETLMVMRWAALFTGIAMAAMTTIVARHVCSWPFAAAAAMLVTVWGWFLVTPNYYSWQAGLLALVALWCYVHGAPKQRWMIYAGIATGAAAMTKQNIGAYVAAGLLLTTWASRLFDTEHDIRGFARHTGEFQQIVHRVGDFAAVVFRDRPARAFDALRLVPKESAGMDHRFEFRRIRIGELLRCFVPLE